MRALATLAIAASLAWLPFEEAGAQDFAAPTLAPAFAGDLIERGLPPAESGASLTALHVRRSLGLTTRSLAADAGFRGVRVAVGVARTGDADLGWSAAAGALGLVTAEGGAALRAAFRRDDDAGPGESRAGVEVGGGAWVRWGDVRAWASAPQAWLGGLSPPLARGLATGLDLVAADCTVALARESPRRGLAESAAYTARVGLAVGGLSIWTEFRDHPWRGGVGVAAEAGPVRCVAQVDSHPVLEPTTRIAITLRSRAERS